MRVLSNCVVPRHSLRAVCYRPVINFFLALAMSCPVIVSPGLTRQAFNLPSYEPDCHGRDLESGDWVIADHEHPAFGKSAFEFARTEQGQPWVTNDGKCLLCDKSALPNHCASVGHANKLKIEFDPMEQLFKIEHPDLSLIHI